MLSTGSALVEACTDCGEPVTKLLLDTDAIASLQHIVTTDKSNAQAAAGAVKKLQVESRSTSEKDS